MSQFFDLFQRQQFVVVVHDYYAMQNITYHIVVREDVLTPSHFFRTLHVPCFPCLLLCKAVSALHGFV